MSSGVWTILADASCTHDEFFVLEEPGRERIVGVTQMMPMEYASLAYTIATNNTRGTAAFIESQPLSGVVLALVS